MFCYNCGSKAVITSSTCSHKVIKVEWEEC